MRFQLLLIALVLSVYSHQALSWGMKELGQEAASPLTTNAKYVLLGGTLVTASLALMEDGVVYPFQKTQVRNKPLGEYSKWGDTLGQLVPNILYVGGMSIAGYYGNTKAYDRALGMFKATAYSSGVTSVLKYTIREPRPNNPQEKNSFPSGHSTTAFAFSGYVAAEHGWGWGSAALLMSTFVGYSRINDNRHYLHDVVAGATIGWAYGWGISKLGKKDPESAYILPLIDSKTAGLSLYKEF